MYLAPLNYDRFFKKVFRDLKVSKKFLEDFLDIEIEQITKLEASHRVTDDSALVEFDFRCKIDGNYVIVDMQQWYKPDVAHRFYLYHTMATALQMEDLPLKSITVNLQSGEEKEVKDYRVLEPVITIVWMVDDTLGCEDDLLAYRMYPEDIATFLNNSELWDNETIKEILEARTKVSDKLENKAKHLDFIQQNRLIFAFQKNIVENKKIKKYIRWFELAAKSREKENKADDFAQFEEDEEFQPVYQRIKKRLIRENLEEDDLQYITDERTRQEQIQRSIDGYVDDAKREYEIILEKQNKKLEERDKKLKEKDKKLEERDKKLKEKDKKLEEKEHVIEESKKALENAVKVLMDKGMSKEEAKKIMGI